MIVRTANAQDLAIIVSLRMRLFAETGELLSSEAAAKTEIATERYFAEHLNSANSCSWVAVNGEVIASVGTLAFFTRPPYPENLAGLEAYVLNMYTLHEYRKQGLAKAILEQAMKLAKERGCGKVWLHASTAGRHLYESMGFRGESSYMEWVPH